LAVADADADADTDAVAELDAELTEIPHCCSNPATCELAEGSLLEMQLLQLARSLDGILFKIPHAQAKAVPLHESIWLMVVSRRAVHGVSQEEQTSPRIGSQLAYWPNEGMDERQLAQLSMACGPALSRIGQRQVPLVQDRAGSREAHVDVQLCWRATRTSRPP